MCPSPVYARVSCTCTTLRPSAAEAKNNGNCANKVELQRAGAYIGSISQSVNKSIPPLHAMSRGRSFTPRLDAKAKVLVVTDSSTTIVKDKWDVIIHGKNE